MSRRIDPTTLMWTQACDLLQQADRMHRQFFRLAGASKPQAWEPPVDVFEDEHDVVVVVAMPGVAPERVQILTEPGALTVRGERPLPLSEGTRALVHQLEIPYGYFERRITLPHGSWQSMSHELANGCLVLRLRK
jgi:HSP20 family molecular chaperone IbpA